MHIKQLYEKGGGTRMSVTSQTFWRKVCLSPLTYENLSAPLYCQVMITRLVPLISQAHKTILLQKYQQTLCTSANQISQFRFYYQVTCGTIFVIPTYFVCLGKMVNDCTLNNIHCQVRVCIVINCCCLACSMCICMGVVDMPVGSLHKTQESAWQREDFEVTHPPEICH